MKSLVEHMAEQEELEERCYAQALLQRMEREPEKRAMPLFEHSSKGSRHFVKADLMWIWKIALKRIEQSLDHLFDGLIAQRQQIGAGVAVDVVGHGLAAKSAKRR